MFPINVFHVFFCFFFEVFWSVLYFVSEIPKSFFQVSPILMCVFPQQLLVKYYWHVLQIFPKYLLCTSQIFSHFLHISLKIDLKISLNLSYNFPVFFQIFLNFLINLFSISLRMRYKRCLVSGFPNARFGYNRLPLRKSVAYLKNWRGNCPSKKLDQSVFSIMGIGSTLKNDQISIMIFHLTSKLKGLWFHVETKKFFKKN